MASRTLISFERTPDRKLMKPGERMMLIRPDIEDAMHKLRRTMADRASRYNVTDWTYNIDDIEFHISKSSEGGSLIRGQLVLTRPD